MCDFNRALLIMALISGTDVSMPALIYRRAVLIFTVIHISKNIINRNKLS